MNVFEKWESDIRGYCRLYPTVFTSASNARQVDEAGKSYIDFFAGAGVLNFGHNNERMKKALIEFIENDGVAHSLDMYTTPKRRFIETFVQTILEPRGMNHKMMFMGPTGTNAVESAMKLARKVTGRQTIVAFNSGFHGMTLGALAATANSYFRNAAGVPLNHILRQPFGCERPCVGCDLGCGLQSVDRLRSFYADASSGLEPPAAFLVEAIQAEGGVHVASQEWLQAIENLAHDLGALLIIDDIQAGCGRTGSYFSFDGMGLDPDIITLAKGIGGFGTPLAMNLIKPEHDKHWFPGEHTGTFRGQGLSFVAGTEALSYFQDDTLMQDVRGKGAQIQEFLQGICNEHSAQHFQVRGKGMMQGIDLRDGNLAKTAASICFESGLLIGACGTGGKVLKLIPPLTIPDNDLNEGLSILSDAIAKALEAA
ncbi:diaminobutyrate--2-oxoglutarate transaminase [Hahella sp. CCB-MM4]|uniref:aspartate aminotransferase family protein n=1 Tax=Hahella sp. (strain CCB-MM4) TaxID=1926491 RepID=UPI000B9B13D0|nr:aspartate aminotransferase family protein [Hahella sp. CCB-MM4]OZG74707.1 diaminobutyrate--2-oxoglutarate transaminase [Hahella sp. CCB-MM4]